MTMWEINEAAKVITDSIDKDAKLIFGAVQDERLKKGELKVTVIATGFSGLAPKPVETPKKTAVNGTFPKAEARTAAKTEAEEEEWDAVPAFLRRRK